MYILGHWCGGVCFRWVQSVKSDIWIMAWIYLWRYISSIFQISLSCQSWLSIFTKSYNYNHASAKISKFSHFRLDKRITQSKQLKDKLAGDFNLHGSFLFSWLHENLVLIVNTSSHFKKNILFDFSRILGNGNKLTIFKDSKISKMDSKMLLLLPLF